MKKIGFKLMLILSLALSILNLTAFAYNTGDDYPEKYKNAAKDSLVDEWNFYNRECTSFTAWCLNSRNGVHFTNQYGGALRWGNAMYWGTVAQGLGITVDRSPAIGSVAWWNTGNYGHVAWVKAINGSNITIDEYNHGVSGGYGERTIAASSVTGGFIHIQDICNSDTYADIGTNFYANIIQRDDWAMVVNNNGSVEIAKENGYANELWWFERQDDGSYHIQSMEDNRYLDVDNAKTDNGTIIKVWEYSGTDAQKWYVKTVNMDLLYIRKMH